MDSEKTIYENSMKNGDIVIVTAGDPLVCGSGRYSHAIVGQADPLILVSEEGDMVWSCSHESSTYKVVGTASEQVMVAVNSRMTRDRNSILQYRVQEYEKLVSFLSSVIKGGEKWSDTCEKAVKAIAKD